MARAKHDEEAKRAATIDNYHDEFESDKGGYYSDIMSKITRKKDFEDIAAAARIFRSLLDDYKFKPNLIWGEERDRLKSKPDMMAELIVTLAFDHAVNDNLGNYYNNVAVILIISGHMNMCDAFISFKDPDSIYYEPMWNLYKAVIKTVTMIKTRTKDSNLELSRHEKEALSIFFYEYFLECYDKDARTNLGVWYTPESVVHFINNTVRFLLAKHFPDQRPQAMDFATGTGTFMIDYIKREYLAFKNKLDKNALRWHLFNCITGVELNDMSYVIAVYNVCKTVYTLLGGWDGEIPLIDIHRPIMLPLYNVNTLSTTGYPPFLGSTKRSNLRSSK